MHQGIITFASQKGWFFAENLTDHTAIFVHQVDVENQRYLKVDDRISFTIIPSRKTPGKTQAGDVKYLGHVVARQVGGDKAVPR
jgi:cold shock CspA family protein